jgi:hypothetical protein
VIVGSLLLILGAVALLALGLVRGSNAYLVASIVASLLAAIALVVGSRQSAARDAEATPARGRGAKRAGEDTRQPAERTGHRHTGRDQMTEVIPAVGDGADQPAEAAEEALARHGSGAVQEAAIPAQAGVPDLDRGPLGQPVLDDDDDVDDEDPPDEPVAQRVSVADAARVARMTNDVLVIDGRPRYHLPGCVHLPGRDSEPLPVREAVELGFTPCGLCEPDSALLAEARRV